MGKSLKERICEGLEDREGLIVPVIRNLMAEAWEEGFDYARAESWRPESNPYLLKEQRHDGSEAFRPR